MVIALIRPAIAVASQVYKHRKAIYAVLTAQDRYISNSLRYGGYGKATSYGVRSGALIGSIAGAFITNAPDSPGNDDAVQKQIPKQYTPRTPYKTRSRYTARNRTRSKNRYCPSPRKRRSSSRKYY